jgi:tellurite resistance protein TehA-like permease
MKNFRVWIFFALLALGIVAIRLLPDLQIGLQAIFSGYGVVAFVLVIVLLVVIYRNLQGRTGKRQPDRDHTPWWY